MELFALMHEHPEGTFIIIIAILATVGSMVEAIINRNRPKCDRPKCECCYNEEEDDEDD